MRALKSVLMLSALAGGVALFSTSSVAALPLSPATGAAEVAARLDQAPLTIQFRRRSYRRGPGAGIAAGIIGGIILGGIIASQQQPYYRAPAYGPYPGGDAVGYCARRFKSYDPYSMTYLGYDGLRHPCP